MEGWKRGGGKQGGEQAQYVGHTVLEKACKAQPVAHPLNSPKAPETEGEANFDGLNFEPRKGFLFLPRPTVFQASTSGKVVLIQNRNPCGTE
jgi:hypothetical protein